MAGRDAGANVGCRPRRANDIRANWHDASSQSSRRALVQSIAKGQALGTTKTEDILRPIDDLEDHSAPEHFDLDIRGVKFPLRGLPNAKPALLAQLAKRIVNRERPTDTLVHHGEAVVRECLIIHRATPNEKPPPG